MIRPGLAFRQLLRELFIVFLLCVGVFLVLLLVGKMLKLQELLFSLDINALDMARLFFFLSPFFLLLLIPVAAMVGMFMTFQRMSADRELMALRSAGVSLIQILPAPLLFLAVCVGINLLISFYGISWGVTQFQDTLLNLAKTKAQLSLQPGVFNQEFPGLTIFARNVDRGSGVLEDVFVQDRTASEGGMTVIAPRGQVRTDHQRGRIYFALSDGRIYRQQGERITRIAFGTYRVSLDMGGLLDQVEVDRAEPRAMSWWELRAKSDDPEVLRSRGEAYVRSLEVEKQKRLALPMACFVLGFFALPMGWMFEGVKRHFGALAVLGMFFVYYGVFTLGLSLGETGALSPAMGVWLPNAAFLGLAAAALRIAVRERGLWFLRVSRKKKSAATHNPA